jgi:hypothetical protein
LDNTANEFFEECYTIVAHVRFDVGHTVVADHAEKSPGSHRGLFFFRLSRSCPNRRRRILPKARLLKLPKVRRLLVDLKGLELRRVVRDGERVLGAGVGGL